MFLICLSTNIIILLLRAEVLDSSVFCPIPLCTRVHQKVAQLYCEILKGMSWIPISSSQCWWTCARAKVVLSGLTVFLASLPLTGSSPSLKGHCSCCLAWFTLNSATWVLFGSLSSIQTRPSQHQANTVTHFHKCKRSAQVGHALCTAYWESRSAW